MDSVEPGIDKTYFVVHYFVTKYRCYCAGVFAKSVDSNDTDTSHSDSDA